MKLRLHGNSVRVRLTQTEVAQLGAGERVEQVTCFSADAKWIASVEPVSQISTTAAICAGNRLQILIPADEARRWATSEQVGIETRQSIEPGETLRILIEKDFECLHGEADESVDAYPNPRAR